MCQCSLKTQQNNARMKIYGYRTPKYTRSCCYNIFSRCIRLHNSGGGALDCMQSEIILSFVPHRALLYPHIVNNNNKIILQFCCKQPRYAIAKI